MIREIIFARDRMDPSQIASNFRPEAQAMEKLGIRVGVAPHDDSEQLFYRGYIMHDQSEYPDDPRFIQGWREYESMTRMSKTYPLIEDISIPTFFVDELDYTVEKQIKDRGWDRAFIKNEEKSLWDEGEFASVWPDNTIETLCRKYQALPYKGVFAVRKFMNPELFFEEERYWVILGQIYHRTGIIPDIVKTAVERLSVLRCHYYTIDAIPGFIVEVNSGEASDRMGVNSPELFSEWWRVALTQ